MTLMLELTPSQVELLTFILESWMDGIPDTLVAVQKDPTLESPEDYLRAVSGMGEQADDTMAIILQVNSYKELHAV